MDEQNYDTVFINDSKDYVHVMEDGSKRLLDLAPGQKAKVRATDSSKSYARWSKITYRADGSVVCDENPNWKMPQLKPGQFATEIFNWGKNDNERIRINDQYVSIYKGVPRYIYPDVTDRDFVLYEKVYFKVELVKKPDPLNPKYLMQDYKTVRENKPRPKKDLERIKAMLLERGMGGKEFLQQIDQLIAAEK